MGVALLGKSKIDKMKRCFLLFFVFYSAISLQAQADLFLPAGPEVISLPLAWRGHNLGAGARLEWVGNQDFLDTLPLLHPGYLRWPYGNPANNYDWIAGLENEEVFNLKWAAQFADTFDTRLQAVVNYGNGSAAEAAALVHFCNDEGEPWQSLRESLLEHPAPLGIEVWEIGNEVTTAWGFGWSWLGYQEYVYGRSGDSTYWDRTTVDSLYFYGGSFPRRGWVKAFGGLNNRTAILGDLVLTDVAMDTLVHAVEFPFLDANSAVEIWATPDYDSAWAATASQQQIYDFLTEPSHKLPSDFYEWDDSTVTIYPPVEIPANTLFLIEYESVGHDGAFDFLSAMKEADSDIRVGYCTQVSEELAALPDFIADFKAHLPDFIIEHPYATHFTFPAAANGLYAEMVYAARVKYDQMYNRQALWNMRAEEWSLPDTPGLGITEWNIALCDECPGNHPFRGIGGGLYTASFWGQIVEGAARGELELHALNHFALLASGYNFLHLFHVNDAEGFEVGNEGIAALMLMQTFGDGMVLLDSVEAIPQIELYAPDSTTFFADALELWSGFRQTDSLWRVLVLNLDPEAEHEVQIHMPEGSRADSLYALFYSGPAGSGPLAWSLEEEESPVDAQTFEVTVPPYSLSLFAFRQMEASVGIPEPVSLPRLWELQRITRSENTYQLHFYAQKPKDVQVDVLLPDGRRLMRKTLHLSEGEEIFSVDVGEGVGALFFYVR